MTLSLYLSLSLSLSMSLSLSLFLIDPAVAILTEELSLSNLAAEDLTLLHSSTKCEKFTNIYTLYPYHVFVGQKFPFTGYTYN